MKLSPVKIWDLPTRIGHWLLVASFATAWLTSDGERYKNIHLAAGTIAFTIAVFRIYWGFGGTRYALFSQFVQHPRLVFQYLKSLGKKHSQHFLGHNPAGGYSILMILFLMLLSCLSGYLAYNGIADNYSEKAHEWVSDGLLAVIAVHLMGVLASSRLHQENLVAAMITGNKTGNVADGINNTKELVAIILLGLVTLSYFLSKLL
jgi:cytochrome b